jgi:hypothetical protein
MFASSASFVEVLRNQPDAIVLHHFCGQCLGSAPLNGPQGLLRNLVQQLLLQGYQRDDESYTTQPPALDFIDGELLCSLEKHKVLSLCHLFPDLVARLDSSWPVFYIVDGVSELETVLYGWQTDICLIIKTLQDLVDDASRDGPALRVLLTSPERSTELADTVVPSDRCVSLLASRTFCRQPGMSLFQRDVDGLLMMEDLEDLPSDTLVTGNDHHAFLPSPLPSPLLPARRVGDREGAEKVRLLHCFLSRFGTFLDEASVLLIRHLVAESSSCTYVTRYDTSHLFSYSRASYNTDEPRLLGTILSFSSDYRSMLTFTRLAAMHKQPMCT